MKPLLIGVAIAGAVALAGLGGFGLGVALSRTDSEESTPVESTGTYPYFSSEK